jgi:hypothetical protein
MPRSWNYRVMLRDGRLAIYTVYYGEGGVIEGWSESPACPEANDLFELRTSLQLMLDAIENPILKYGE